jgi:hypothetical protein
MKVKGDELQIHAREARRDSRLAGQKARTNRKPGELLDEASAAFLVNFDMGTPW